MIAVLGLLTLVSGALLPAAAQEQTTNQSPESFLASSGPASSADVSASSGVTDLPGPSSLPPDRVTSEETERPETEASPSTSVRPTEAEREGTAANPSTTSPGLDTGDGTSANPTSETPSSLPATPSLISILMSVTAKNSTEALPDPTERPASASDAHSTWMTAITTSLFITTTVTITDAAGPATDGTATRRTSMAAAKMEPAVLEVGDEKELPNHHRNSSNPLFVMIVSVFTVMVVIVVVVVGFHLYKKRNSRTEFRRLQDLPMDDMMEDTPLSLYSY